MDDVGRRAAGPEWQEAVEAVVRAARTALAAEGWAVSGPGFPFALHHARYRGLAGGGGRKARHREVAQLLGAWASEHGDADAYAWQAVAGAVARLDPCRPLPDALAREMEAARGRTEGFDEWLARRRVS